jgi:ThiF family
MSLNNPDGNSPSVVVSSVTESKNTENLMSDIASGTQTEPNDMVQASTTAAVAPSTDATAAASAAAAAAAAAAADTNGDTATHTAGLETLPPPHRLAQALGATFTHRLSKIKVCVIGLLGVGAETIRHLAFDVRPSMLVLVDNEDVTVEDLGVNFGLSKTDIGKKRSLRMKAALELLTNVDIQAHTGEVNEHFLSNFDVVVLTDTRYVSFWSRCVCMHV